jgi:nucleotide-binding universal stress UspA family protein
MGTLLERQKTIAQSSDETLRQIGIMQDVQVIPDVQVGTSPEAVILGTADSKQIDLIILGTNVGVGSNHLYLGPRVERILNNAHCPVIVINS